ECRIYAEDPFHKFRPSPGLVIEQQYPHGPGIRLDNGIYQGFEIPMEYDPILSKLVSYGSDRQEALQRMKRALTEYRISGPTTNLYFHLRALEIEDFATGRYDTHFVDKHLENILKVPGEEKTKALMAAALARFLNDEKTKPSNDKTMAQDASGWRMLGRQRNLS
ncbi:MAG: acetyl-CoA carboxylase biotin carboxylase subunit, partial [bacterium]|nr:acetyl-CoA carboxylase biotin carboxylase subunit [bacterium]